MDSTAYAEVLGTDTDVAAFVAAHPYDLNLYRLPVKMWVARQGGSHNIVAVLMLKVDPYVSVDLIVAEPKTRPFMRIVKLWRMAEAWLKERNVPICCVSIHNSQVHFQSLVRRLGFEKIGDEENIYGQPVETIFAKSLNGGPIDLSLH